MRQWAARGLGNLGGARAVNPLIGALDDVDGEVRQWVVRSLSDLGDERAVAPEPVSAYFGELTRVWQAVAYADQTPAESRVQALCDGWREHFGMTS